MWRETSFTTLDAVVQDVIASPFDGPSGRPLVLSEPASGGELHPSTLARIQVRLPYEDGVASACPHAHTLSTTHTCCRHVGWAPPGLPSVVRGGCVHGALRVPWRRHENGCTCG